MDPTVDSVVRAKVPRTLGDTEGRLTKESDHLQNLQCGDSSLQMGKNDVEDCNVAHAANTNPTIHIEVVNAKEKRLLLSTRCGDGWK